MIRYSETEPYDSGDVVCVALVRIGQAVDWSPQTQEPELAVWVPEGTFERIGAIAQRLGFPVFYDLNIYEQNRVSAAQCSALLARWDEMEAETLTTPAAPWAARIRELLRQCASSVGRNELLVEGP